MGCCLRILWYDRLECSCGVGDDACVAAIHRSLLMEGLLQLMVHCWCWAEGGKGVLDWWQSRC
jgi:hypothetical protein